MPNHPTLRTIKRPHARPIPSIPMASRDANPTPPPRRAGIKLAVRIVLFALTLAALAWVIAPIVTGWPRVRALFSTPAALLALLVGTIAYAGLLWLCMAPGWWWLTRLYGRSFPLLPTAAVWCRTQIVKYLPGNVAHYLGRQVLGTRIGLHQAEMAAASLLELVSILAAAGLIGAAGLLLGAWSPTNPSPPTAGAADRLWAGIPILIAILIAGLLAWPTADAVLRRLPFARAKMDELPRLSPIRSLTILGPTLLIHAAFLIATGTLLWWLAVTAAPAGSSPPSFLRMIWVYAVAWAVGTIAPGAPAGAGVREAIITLELASDLGRPEAAAIALALRLITTLGDALAFAASLAVPIDRPRESAALPPLQPSNSIRPADS